MDRRWGLLAALVLVVPSPARAGSGVCLYSQPNYGGSQFCLSSPQGISDLGTASFDNVARSIRVPKGLSVQLYLDKGYVDEMVILSDDVGDLASIGWSSVASSMKVRDLPGACFYPDGSLSGEPTCGQVGDSLVFDAPVMSFAWQEANADIGGMTIELFSEADESGDSVILVPGETTLPPGWVGVAMSARLQRYSCDWRELPVAWPLDGDPSARLAYANSDPFAWTVTNHVALTSDNLDFQGNRGHNGIDMGTPSYRAMFDEGIIAIAAAPGVVDGRRDGIFDRGGGNGDPDEWRYHPPLFTDGLRDWNGAIYDDGSGNVVFVRHTNGFLTQYAHLRRGLELGTQLGARVEAGQMLGVVGSSGGSGNPHLHFGIWASNECQALYPLVFSPTRRTDTATSRISVRGVPKNLGVFIDPYFEEPGDASRMWSGPVPVYRPHLNAWREVFDIAVNDPRILPSTPAPDISVLPLGRSLDTYVYYSGGFGLVRIRVTKPDGTWVQSSAGANSMAFTPRTTGRHWIRALRNTPEAPGPVHQVRAATSVMVRDWGRPLSVPASSVATDTARGTTVVNPPTEGVAQVGEESVSSHQGKRRVFLRFSLAAARRGGSLRYGVLRLRRESLLGIDPWGVGFGWGGRMSIDQVNGAGQVVRSRIGQFNRARANGDWAEAVIDPAALAALPNEVRLRVSLETANNRNFRPDRLSFHVGDTAATAGSRPNLVLYRS